MDLTLPLLIGSYLLTLSLVGWVLLTKSHNPTATVAWLMLIIAVPIFGGVLFLVFGVNRVNRRGESVAAARLKVARNLPELTQYHLFPSETEREELEPLMRLGVNLSDNIPTYGNRVELLTDTNRAFGLIEQAIGEAKETIHLEYYIWRPDEAGTTLRDLLIKKAREGVKIRFLYDKFGSMLLNWRFLRPMREVGIEVASFLPGASLRERWSINLRNHRKLIVCDGQTAFTGGMNIGDEYLGRNKDLGYWRDTHLRVTGPAVPQLQQIFVEDWYFATGEQVTKQSHFPPPTATGQSVVQVLAGGPDTQHAVFHNLMFAAINEARNRVTLSTSFFVPTPALNMALETAALRGVSVRLLVAGKSMHRATLFAARSYYGRLLRAGAEIYEFREGLLHSKTLTIDGKWSLVGSPNFDARSVLLNFEIAVATFDNRLALKLEEGFLTDLDRATKIQADEWANRGTGRRLVENFCRLFAPVM